MFCLKWGRERQLQPSNPGFVKPQKKKKKKKKPTKPKNPIYYELFVLAKLFASNEIL
jgi:hypothetical protein